MRNVKKPDNMAKVENESTEILERILRKFESNESIQLTSCKSALGSHIGDNYMSVVKRVSVIGKSNREPGLFDT